MSVSTTGRVMFVLLTTASMLIFAPPASAGWLGSYGYRQEVVVNPSVTPGNLTDFPLLVKISDPANHLFGNTAFSNGQDIVFTASDGVTPLEREIEHFTAAGSKELDAWVKTSVSSTAPTRLYMYYNGPTSTNSTATWDTYRMVQHLNEAPANGVAGHLDSTGNGFSGTPSGFTGSATSTTAGSGPIDGANVFDGGDALVLCGDVSAGNWPSATVEAWINWTGATENNYSGPYYKGSPGNDLGRFLILPSGQVLVQNGNGNFTSAAGAVPANQWAHIAYVYDQPAGKEYILVDGAVKGQKSRTGDIPGNGAPLHIGWGFNTTDHYGFFGAIDEFRVSDVPRSAEWIQASINNQADPAAHQATGQVYEQGTDALKGYSYRQAITISKDVTDADMAAFPALIKIDDSGNPLFANANSVNGYDIVFTRADGITRLDHDLESFSAASGSEQLAAWVNTPLSASQDTVIYMYYGSGASEDPSSVATWDGNFRTVQHLNESPANGVAGHLDSTGNGFSGTPSGFTGTATSTTAGSGQIDGADVFDGGDALVLYGDVSDGNWSSATVEAWINWTGDTESSFSGPYYKGSMNSDLGRFLIRPSGQVLVQNGNGSFYSAGAGDVPADQWAHIAYVYDQAAGKEYILVNGEIKGEKARTGDIPGNGSPLHVGWGFNTTQHYGFFGTIDEFRISDIARDPYWIQANYNFMLSPDSYLGFGVQQTVPEPASLVLLVLGGLFLLGHRRRRKR